VGWQPPLPMAPQLQVDPLGKRGGDKTASLYGKEHYSKIGKKKKPRKSTETEPNSDQENKKYSIQKNKLKD
jgi:hypothetical protein